MYYSWVTPTLGSDPRLRRGPPSAIYIKRDAVTVTLGLSCRITQGSGVSLPFGDTRDPATAEQPDLVTLDEEGSLLDLDPLSVVS